MDMVTRRTVKRENDNTTVMTTSQNQNDDRDGDDGSRRVVAREVSPLEIASDDVHRDPPKNDGVDATSGGDDEPSMEERYRSERERTKLRHWRESEHAAGLVEPSWSDELENYRRRGCCCGGNGGNGNGGGCCCETGQVFREEIDPGCGCNYMSAAVCSRLGAGRIGNMVVLRERYVMVEAAEGEEEDDEGTGDEEVGGREREDGFVDEEEAVLHQRSNGGVNPDSKDDVDENGNEPTGTPKKRMVRRREIQFVLGPFWPMLLFITYPLIFGVSALTLRVGIPGKPWYVQLGWALTTTQLIRSLFNTGFRDPGILRRRRSPPPVGDDENDEEDRPQRRLGMRWGVEDRPWRWSDQAQSYRPGNSTYCPDCKVVIEEFDHTCPWTGTAIGKKNMASFQMFVGLVFVCLIMDIFLLTSGAM